MTTGSWPRSAFIQAEGLLILVFGLVMSSLFAENFALSHARHDCSGEGCPVCLAIRETGNFLRHFKSMALYSNFPISVFSTTALALGFAVFYGGPINAVRLKVKMNE
jgi:hypothetical protein